jgi:hypothetical protein
MIKGIFKVLIGDELLTYSEYDEIPLHFDNLIQFAPEIPPEPHTEEQHEWIESLPEYMNELMSREQK